MIGKNASNRFALVAGAALAISACVCTTAAILGRGPLRSRAAVSLRTEQSSADRDAFDGNKTDEFAGPSGGSLAGFSAVPDTERFEVDPVVFLAQTEPDEDLVAGSNPNGSRNLPDSIVPASATATAGSQHVATAEWEPSSTDAPEGLAGGQDKLADERVEQIRNFGASTRPLWKGTDLDGSLRRLPDDPSVQTLVIVFLSTDCPISNAAIAPLNRLADDFASTRRNGGFRLRLHNSQPVDEQSPDHPSGGAPACEANRLSGGVEFYGVISSGAVTRAAAVAHRDQYEIGFPVLFDVSGELRTRLQPTHTPEAFVLTPQGRILYRGRIDDRFASVGRKKLRAQRHDLREAIRQIVAGEPVTVPNTEPIGCLIEEPPSTASDGEITYARHIAPIIQSNCVSCHRPGESAPFSLTSFDDVAKRARQIREVTESGLMPPWRPVPGFGEFRGERYLSDSEIELMAQWADAGAPRGDPADMPPPPKFTTGWRLGEPDVVYTVSEPFDIPAEGDDIYQYFVIPSGLTRDRVISAIEFRPGNPQVIHHASFSYDTRGIARKYDAIDPRPGYQRFGGPGFLATGTLGGWASGVTPRHLPDGVGRLIRKGADLVVQVHYHPTGKPERDQSKLGLHFADGERKQLLVELIVADMHLRIPPGAAEHGHDASYILPTDVIVHGVAPHMHLLGRTMKVTAIRPDGPPEWRFLSAAAQFGAHRQAGPGHRLRVKPPVRRVKPPVRRIEPLIRIDDWDFNWQDFYFFREPILLSRGTRIVVEAEFDNSSSNPVNPNSPPILVRWGERSDDEMCVCFFDVTTPDPADRQRLWNHNREYVDEQFRAIPWLQNTASSIGRSNRLSGGR